MFKVFLKDNTSFECESGDTIVNAAMKNGVFLDHSCLSGRCSSCKFKVIKGDSIASENEISLSEDDVNKNYILTCVRKPLSDIYLDAEDLSSFGLKKPKTLPSKVASFEKLTDLILKVKLRLPPTQNFEFIEGQYVDIIKGSIKRSYSIASSSSSDNLEFLIKNYEGGFMSQYWFNDLAINDLLRIEGPKGTFFLRNNHDKDTLVFVGTGTGIAPIKSIIESENFDEKTKHIKNIFIFWGMGYSEEIFWKPNNSRVKFVPVLSRETDRKLYVQNVIFDYHFNLESTVVYACGSDIMISELKSKFLNSGLNEKDFFSDSFVQSN
ncbi:FAD-binding oxidoreductase [Belliella pelovolcani]|uniref:CDP-4-dehydro-6-deoxyglucose reductase n=1 Tax=Belliella pelovolcani TaxID=529505 RepID=A0A1N7MF30_9BACT|nr:FAD-binding oxidoreductase [Belliella pelovolcani]SIS84571.1 CDP-4-dehydro-6-deoxyglucose reductase [Belliella pelovolcani]